MLANKLAALSGKLLSLSWRDASDLGAQDGSSRQDKLSSLPDIFRE